MILVAAISNSQEPLLLPGCSISTWPAAPHICLKPLDLATLNYFQAFSITDCQMRRPDEEQE